ncbi:MAG: VWA domain-containing protein, partial [Pseudomonadota bacterium]
QAELIARVTQAEAALQDAQTRLQNAHTEGDPVIAAYEAAQAERAAASQRVKRALDRVDAALDRRPRIPVELDARHNALADVLIRMYNNNADPAAIARREAQLADVKRQIERIQAGSSRAQQQIDAASAERDAAIAALRALDRRIDTLSIAAGAARTLISRYEDAVAEARDELERARSDARWRLNDDPPPILSKVEVKRGRNTFYEAEWVSAAEENEELLRLAQYLHEDLGRTIPMRRQRVEEWITIVEGDQERANAALKKYVDMIGGSYDSGFWSYVERGLDAVTFGYGGALVTGGSHTWKKIGVELADAAVSVGVDMAKGMPPHAALLTEMAFQLGDLAWNKGVKNPDWDVTRMPMANGAVVSSRGSVSAADEQRIFQSLNGQTIRASLERMREQVKDGLDSEGFRNALLQEHGGMTLAAAFTEATFRGNVPDLNISDRPMLGKEPLDWVFSQFTTPTGVLKSLMKETMFEDNPRKVKAIFEGALQSAVKDGLLEELEKERLETWSAWLEADVEVQLSVANLRNEGRLRRMEEKIRKVLADEIIPALTQEIESQRAERNFELTTNAGVTGRRATLELTFSRPVIIESVTLAGEALDMEGADEAWRAEFVPGDFDVEEAQLVVTARHAALEDRQLDDPSTVASWSTSQDRFNSYEQGPDQYHKILLDPPTGAGYAIVLDTSGSMNEDGNNRIGRAQTALTNLLGSGRIEERDMVSLFTYSGCYVNQTVPFTNDLTQVQEQVDKAGAEGGTPLADSILVAADALAEQNIERGIMIVVTDGADSCEGSVPDALRQAREKVESIRRRLIR